MGRRKKKYNIYGLIITFVGTELDPELSYAKVADACGLKGVTVRINGRNNKSNKTIL